MRRLFASLLFTAAMLGAAQAADCYPNVAGTQANCGEVQMWNNGSGQSQPTTAAAPLPTVQTGALPAGTALIGKVGIDQTTPGTTNAVSTEGNKATYSTTMQPALVASATDVCTLLGSGTKTIRITRIEVSGTATSAANFGFSVRHYVGGAYSGGTGTNAAVALYDSNNAAATSVPKQFTANPTVGAGTIYVVRTGFAYFNTTASTSQQSATVYDFGTRNSQTLVLRGASEYMAVNLLGQTITGGQITCMFEWTEE